MSRLIPAGRKILLMGLNAPYSTRGFDPNAFARRVQDLLAPLAPRVALDPQVPVNPYAELWVEVSIIEHNNRVNIMATAAIVVDGTFTMEELARVLARAVRDAGAGGEVVPEALAERMLSCDDSPFFWNTEFGGCCLTVNLPANQTPRALTIPATPPDRFVVRGRTTVRQGVQPQPVPVPIEPDSIMPTLGPTPTPSGTGAYGGDAENPVIPDDRPVSEDRTRMIVGGALAAVALALTVGAIVATVSASRAAKALPPAREPAAARAPARRQSRPARRGR